MNETRLVAFLNIQLFQEQPTRIGHHATNGKCDEDETDYELEVRGLRIGSVLKILYCSGGKMISY